MATLLSIVQDASSEMGLAVPNAVASSTANDVLQLKALATAVGKDLVRRNQWQALIKEYRFTLQFSTLTGTITKGSAIVTGLSSTSGLDTTYMVVGTGMPQDTFIQSVDSATQVTLTQAATASGSVSLTFSKTKYALPSDYDRPVNRTQWDKTKRWELLGPSTGEQWQWLKSGWIASGPRIRWRILGGFFQIWPPQNTGEYIGWEYVSRNWVSSSSGTGKEALTDDADTFVYNERLMITGIKYRYFSVKGFDTTDYKREYDEALELAISQDAGAATLSMAPRLSSILISADNIPDANYGN